jgi:hypothetical protein
MFDTSTPITFIRFSIVVSETSITLSHSILVMTIILIAIWPLV